MSNSEDEISLKTKTGKDIVLDFLSYSYNEYSFNDSTIYLGSEVTDSFNENYTVQCIKTKIIVLKDSEGTIYGIPKEDIIYYKIVSRFTR